MVGGTPLESIDIQLSPGKNRNRFSRDKVITIRSDKMEDALNMIENDIGNEMTRNFVELFKKNIILELERLPSSKSSARLDGKATSLRKEIIDSITPIKLKRDSEGNLNATFSITHKLAYALDQGTGIYGPEGKPISAKKGYMFIPGDEFARDYYMRKFKKSGMSEVDAKRQITKMVRARRMTSERIPQMTRVARAKGVSEAQKGVSEAYANIQRKR